MPQPSIFQRLIQQGRGAGFTPTQVAQGQRESIAWYREKAQTVRSVNTNRLLSETPNRMFARGSPEDIGSLILFQYDPKLKAKLPYWDQVPLCFPFSFDRDGFTSIQMHYLPPTVRAALFDQLLRTAVVENDRIKRLAISYQILAGSARFRAFRPAIKKHLFSHMRSKMMLILPSEWPSCLFLPLARWVGASEGQVWRDSRRIIRNA